MHQASQFKNDLIMREIGGLGKIIWGGGCMRFVWNQVSIIIQQDWRDEENKRNNRKAPTIKQFGF